MKLHAQEYGPWLSWHSGGCMAYRTIDSEIKARAVLKVLKGERISRVAAEIGADRDSLTQWLRRSLRSMQSGFERPKRIRRVKHGERAATIRALKERAQRQRRSCAQLKDAIKRISEGPIPEQCPRCGCRKLYRNGFIQLDLWHALGERRNGAGRRIPVQKFCCAHCGHSTRMQGASALYHWVFKSVNGLQPGRRGDGKRD